VHSEQDVVARRGRLPVALAVVAALAIVAALALRFLVFGPGQCSGGITLRVAASPEIAPALREISNAWQDDHPSVGGTCVNVAIEATATPVVASRLTVLAGNGIDVAAAPEPTPSEDQLPTVWIPDSTAWLRRVQQVDRAAFADNARSVASSPVVAAMPADVASAVGASVRLDTIPTLMASGSFRLALAEPRRETASLAAAALLGAAVAPTEEQLPVLVRMLRGIVKTAAVADMLPALGTQASAGAAAE
jgi:Ca-activated chloride channel homolog